MGPLMIMLYDCVWCVITHIKEIFISLLLLIYSSSSYPLDNKATVSAIDQFRTLPFDAAVYGFQLCVSKLNIEEPIYNRFDFVYPPYDNYATQFNTNDAFRYIKRVTIPKVMNCMYDRNLTRVLINKNVNISSLVQYPLEYDRYRMNFTSYVVLSVQDHTLDKKNYPLYEKFISDQLSFHISKRRLELRFKDAIQQKEQPYLLRKLMEL